MDEVTGAVAATGEIAKAASPLIENLAKLTGPMCEEMGLYFGDKVRAFRQKNITNVIEGSVRKLEATGKPVNAVPPRLLIPIFEAASVEDNPTLQDMWSGLLASASDQADAMSPSFVETLKALTPIEAKALGIVYVSRSHFDLGDENDLIFRLGSRLNLSFGGPTNASLILETFERLGLIRREYEILQRPAPPVKNSMISQFIYKKPGMQDGFVESQWPVKAQQITDPSPEVDWKLVFTAYGIQFMEACEGPNPLTGENKA